MLHREATEQNNSSRCHSAVILSVWMIIYVFYRHFLKMASPSIPALALLLWSYTKGNNGVAEESFSFKKSFSILEILLCALFVLLWRAILAGLYMFFPPSVDVIEGKLTMDASMKSVIFGIVIGPALEEYFFRCVLWKQIKPFGKILTLFTTSVIFASFHTFYSRPSALVGGILLGFLLLLTKDLRVCFLAHAINNSGILIVADASQIGFDIQATAFLNLSLGSLIVLLLLFVPDLKNRLMHCLSTLKKDAQLTEILFQFNRSRIDFYCAVSILVLSLTLAVASFTNYC